jgi:DNA-directed RNA polymerase specialized sigma24 family protein
MPTAEEFDDFYVGTRRGLVVQTFALTGDLPASRNAVRDAYVAARHHWEKVGRSADPESWVRPRAWAAAQRRRAARPIHRERHLDADQAATIAALHKLPDAQRRTLVLTHLTDLPLHEVAREAGFTLARLSALYDAGTDAVAASLGCEPEEVGDHLAHLEAATVDVKLPRPSIIRRNGMRRRRNHAVVGSLVIAAMTVAAGSFVAVGAPAAAPAKQPPPMKAEPGKAAPTLLTAAQVANLSPGSPWSPPTDTKNVTAPVIRTMCQQSLFADNRGLGTMVRRFTSAGRSPRSLIQTLEISNSPGAAKSAYDTVLGWYAGCTVPRIQLLDSYTVAGVGDEAQVIRMRVPGAPDRSYVVALARTGALTTSTVLETATAQPVPASTVAATLATSVRDLCGSRVAGTCVGAVRTAPALPPPSGETAGMLSIVDLPVIPKVRRAWSGTAPSDATKNPAATTCDRANFATSGAAKPVSRSYLILDAGLPARFGLTETVGTFTTAKQASAFVDQVVARMARCEGKELGSTVTQRLVRSNRARGESFALWRLGNQVDPHRPEVLYWVGIARLGAQVTQLLMTPVKSYDISQATFGSLLTRARDRLHELG